MKTFIRVLWGDDPKSLWDNDAQREALRHYLNDQGFYVLTGAGDSLEVYAISEDEAWDIKFWKKSLDKIQKVWYTILRKEVRQ